MRGSSSLTFILLFCYGIFREISAFHSRHRKGNAISVETTSTLNFNIPTNQDFITNNPPPENFDDIRSRESQSHHLGGPESARVPFAVETFANHFISLIKASEGLLKAFKISRFSPEEAGKSLYRVVHSAAIDTGTRNSDFIAQLVEEAVKLNHHLASDESFLNMYGYAMGKFLLLMRALTPENAYDLAQQYFECIRNGIISEDGTLDGDIRGIADGFIAFVDSLGMATSNTVPILVVHFANEWYKLRS